MGKQDDQHQDKIAVYYLSELTDQSVSDIQYALQSAFDHVYFLAPDPKKIEELIKEPANEELLKRTKFNIVTEKIFNTADAFRTIDAMSIVSTDFVFLEGGLKTNDPLLPLLENHKATAKKDKNAILTLVCSLYIPGHQARSEKDDEKVLVIDENRKVLAWNDTVERYVDLPKEAVDLGNARIRFDLISSGVYICTPKIPALFTENFDFHDMRDLVKHALLEDEVVTSNLYVEEVKGRITGCLTNHFLSKKDLFSILPKPIRRQSYSEPESETESEDDEVDGDDEETRGFDAFFREVHDSLERGYSEKLQPNDLVLEINGSRYAYNIDSHIIGSFVVKAILTLNTQIAKGKEAAAQLENLKKLLKVLLPVMKNYVAEDKQEAQRHSLKAIEEYIESEPVVLKYVHHLILQLHQEDVFSSEVIIEWHTEVGNPTLKKSVEKFVEWLQDEDEDSESEEDEESEEE